MNNRGNPTKIDNFSQVTRNKEFAPIIPNKKRN